MKTVPSLLFAFVCYYYSFAQSPSSLAHTFSIVAYDFETGEIGAAVQSHWFSTGTLVIWGEAGVGAIATQSFVNPAFGMDGLQLLKAGKTPKEVLEELIAKDQMRGFRQVGIVNAKGQAAAYTGDKCIAEADHIIGNGYAVQANMMLNNTVWTAMAEAFEHAPKLPLAERLILTLEAAQQAGGDIRGQQSAALLVVGAQATGMPWVDRKIDLRVDDHPTPISELKRLLSLHRAYEHMNKGDLAMENGDTPTAMREYAIATAMFPENEEMTFWYAINMINAGDTKGALPILKNLFQKNNNWQILLGRLVQIGLLHNIDPTVEQIMPSKKP